MANLFQNIRNIELLEFLEENVFNPRIPRVIFRDRQNPFEEYSDSFFHGNLGFTKQQFVIVLDKFKDKFAETDPNHPPMLQFIVFMQYVKSNEFLRSVTTQNIVQLPISTVGEIVNNVATDIASFSQEYIAYPSQQEQNVIAARMLEKYGMPGCPSIMDGCQVEIWKPAWATKHDQDRFINRKGKHRKVFQFLSDK